MDARLSALRRRLGWPDTAEMTRGSLSEPPVVARTLGVLYVGGATVALGVTALPLPDGTNLPVLFTVYGAAYAVGIALILAGRRTPRVLLWPALALATVLVCAGIVLTTGRAAIYSLFLVALVMFAFFLLPRGLAVAHATLTCLLYAGVLAAEGVADAPATWTVTAGTVLVVGLLVGFLRERVDVQIAIRERSEATVREQRDFLDALLENLADGVVACDADGQLTLFNRATREFHGIPERPLPPEEWSRRYDLYHADGVTPMEMEEVPLYRAYRGEPVQGVEMVIAPRGGRQARTVVVSGRSIVDEGGRNLGAVVAMHDITDRKRVERELRYLAEHDAMTGLLNRRRFTEELEGWVARARAEDRSFAVVELDIDNLKHVNEALGNHAGDGLIMEVARLLRRQTGEPGVLGRLGGDEFALVLPGADAGEAEGAARDLVRSLREGTELLQSHGVRSTVSAGIAVFDPAATVEAEELLVEADLAMYDAKERGRAGSALSRRDRTGRRGTRLDWASRIRSALAEDRFILHTQPILDLETGAVAGHEVLVRMLADDGEVVPPDAFLPVAERFGLIASIDRFVVRRSVELMAYHRSLGRPLRLNVNLSAHSLSDEEMPGEIERALTAENVEPGALTLEVTETAAIASIAEARAFAERLTRLGCHLALDDFGAGFGSFYYLKHLPFDTVKIDGEFVRDLPRSESDRLLVAALVELAHGLGKRTVAEFVEDEETLELVRKLGVDYGQGHHIGSPGALNRSAAGLAESHP